jgi:hypothetical protein
MPNDITETVAPTSTPEQELLSMMGAWRLHIERKPGGKRMSFRRASELITLIWPELDPRQARRDRLQELVCDALRDARVAPKPYGPIRTQQAAAFVLFDHRFNTDRVARALDLNRRHAAVLKSYWRRARGMI